jgi:uncharacterized membrane protein
MRSLMHRKKRTTRHPGRWVIKSFSLFAAVVLLTVILPSSVFAQSGITIGTPYPGVEVRPGETIEFPLKVRNNTSGSQKVEIRMVSVPDNWEWTLEGGGRSVDRVFVDGNSYENIKLNIDIPADAKEGRYQVVLEARGTGSSSRLTIDMQIKEDAKQSSEISVEYPDLEGSPSTAFKFRVDITNNSSQAQSYSLAANVPRGWQAAFSPAYSSEKIASISVEPNKNQGLDVNIDPPDLVEAGEYTIPIIAKSAGETLRQDLRVIIKGTYDIKLTTPTGRLSEDAYAGRQREVKLLVSNTGSGDLADIEMRSWEPKNWEVEFEPKEIDLLKPGESKEVKAYIKPDSKALAGDYVVELTAAAPEDISSAEFRITVKTSTTWGLVGGILIAGLAGGLYFIFNKYGRR